MDKNQYLSNEEIKKAMQRQINSVDPVHNKVIISFITFIVLLSITYNLLK